MFEEYNWFYKLIVNAVPTCTLWEYSFCLDAFVFVLYPRIYIPAVYYQSGWCRRGKWILGNVK